MYQYLKRRDKILKKSLKIKSSEIISMLIKMLIILWAKMSSKLNKNKSKKRKWFRLSV